MKTETCWKLPPLILHPFTSPTGTERIVESSRANLILQGLLPNEQFSSEDLQSKLVAGRYSEICMLFYVGKDLCRWMEQCGEFVRRTDELAKRGLSSHSFAAYLVEDPPEQVKEKLQFWGVVNFRTLFSRAIGLYSVFGSAPDLETLSPGFILHYYRFADHMFACRQQLEPYTPLDPDEFEFELYASREYANLLEEQWGTIG
jgi:hypothetical protein